MNLAKMAVKRPVATGAILVLILVIGLVSLSQSPLDLLPDIEAPVLAVITALPGSSPQESLELVTRPIEESVSTVGGVTGINSISRENTSLVIVLFDWGADVKNLREDIRMRMDLVDLPDDASRPMILEFDPTLMPIMQISASGADDPARLTAWLQETAAPRLESIRGVAEVQIQGGVEEDIFVRANPKEMAEYEISFGQIANVLRTSLMDLPAGIVDLEDRQVRLRFLGRYAEPELLSDLIVGFKVDQEELDRLIGEEIELDLNRLIEAQDFGFAGSGSGGMGSLPVRELYWDDIFDFNSAVVVGESIILPITDRVAGREDLDLERSMRLFTVNPEITLQAESNYLNLSLSSLGLMPVSVDEAPNDSSFPVKLEQLWLIEYASWDQDQVIVPLDPAALQENNISSAGLTRLAERHPLITQAAPGYILISFHQNWPEIREEPLISIPDLQGLLSDLESGARQGLNEASGGLEDLMIELTTTMLGGNTGGSSTGANPFSGVDLGDDIPVDPVTLGMVAEIEKTQYEPSSFSRYNMQPSIGLSIQKEGDANTVTVARQVREVLDELSEESIGTFSQISFDTIFDQAEEIEFALADLARSLLGGAVLAIVVLLLFLKNWRTTMFIGLSIPSAIIATFTLLYFTDITINLMTLGGLALAAGMLVDNAIVVSENIYRQYQLGENPNDAAIKGAREVAGAITASTLTTISVFFPVVFLSGLAGQLFWEFALTVGCAILASLFMALTVIPLLASRTLQRRHEQGSKLSSLPRLPSYRRALKFTLHRPWLVLLITVIFVAGGALGFTTLGTELFPSPEESSFTVNISLPPGSTLETTDAYVSEIESILEDQPDVANYSVRTGGSGFMGMRGGGGASNEARIRVDLDPAALGEIDRVIEEVRSRADRLPYEAVNTYSSQSVLDTAGFEARLELVVSGDNLEEVTRITGQAADILAEHPRFSDVQSSLEENRPEVHIRLDHSEALQKGVTLSQVASAVRESLEGIPVSRIETAEGIMEIVLGYEKQEINTLEDLSEVGFYTAGGEFVRISEVAELEEAFGPRSIPRENRRIVGQIEASYGDLDLGTAAEEAFAALEQIALPDGYTINTAGSVVVMDEVLDELALILIVAMVLVYLVMAAQFESLLHPFIIILTLPMAYAGSVLALMITGNNISVPALIGLIVLSGILVNDGIIMVDYINQQRRLYGLELNRAILEGAAARLRPIMMTTATTALGLFPLALGIGEGAELQAPMAITIIGGQFTGTLLLLLAVPAIYKMVTREHPDQGAAKAALAYTSPAGDDRGKPLMKMVLRMVIVLILAALILILFNVTGQETFMVIR